MYFLTHPIHPSSFARPQGDTPVLMLDCNEEFEADEERQEELMSKLEEFLCSLGVKESPNSVIPATELNTDHAEADIAFAH